MTFKVNLYVTYDFPQTRLGYDNKYDQAESWACENCSSYIKREFFDLSDVDSWNGEYDFWFEYEFGNEEDAMMFQLKWG